MRMDELKPLLHVVSFSGGKDSTAMLLKMLEMGMQVDVVLFCDTSLEFPALYDHVHKVEQDTGMKVTTVKSEYTFEYLMLHKPIKRKKPELRGKTAELHVKLHKIQKQILPELDDEFAKKLGFADAEAMKKQLADQAGRAKASQARSEAEQTLLDSCLEGQEFPLPESVVSMHRTEYENELRSYLQQQGLDKDAVENSIKSMSDECRKQGEERARAFLFLMALARREKLEVQPQEIDFQIMQMAQQYKEDYHKLRETLYSNGAVSDIRDRMLNRKALNLLFDKAQKTEAAQESQPAAE